MTTNFRTLRLAENAVRIFKERETVQSAAAALDASTVYARAVQVARLDQLIAPAAQQSRQQDRHQHTARRAAEVLRTSQAHRRLLPRRRHYWHL